jgi:cobalt-zinc-cadmium efflux system membrane fusion protein
MHRYLWSCHAFVFCCVLAASACSRTHAQDAVAPAVTVDEATDANIVTVAHPDQFPLVAVTTLDTHAELPVTGVVAPDVSRTVPVNALASGRVVDLRVRLGDTVRKGQVLMSMASADVGQALADLQKFQADAELARRAHDRARTLSEHEALAAKDLEAASNADDKAQADLRSAQEKVRLLGGNAEHPSSTIDLRAPVSGTIVEQNVTSSAGVKSLDNSPNLFTIADLSRVWVLCDVYENNLQQVRLGDHAAVRLNAYPDRPLTARVSNISRVLDPATRTAKVRLELENREDILKPGMFATVTFTAQQTVTRPVLPASAVLRLHDKDWVFIPAGGSRFKRIEIQTAPGSRDQLQAVLSGLRPGDRVVANALQLSSVADQ